MIDPGEVFTARRMLSSLGRSSAGTSSSPCARRDGVPGILRVGLLVAFHLYVWAAFWHLSGRLPSLDADDALLRRLDLALVPLRLAGRAAAAFRRKEAAEFTGPRADASYWQIPACRANVFPGWRGHLIFGVPVFGVHQARLRQRQRPPTHWPAQPRLSPLRRRSSPTA